MMRFLVRYNLASGVSGPFNSYIYIYIYIMIYDIYTKVHVLINSNFLQIDKTFAVFRFKFNIS